MLVAVDKFTKWIEAKPINSPDGASAIKFVKSIVFRFGVPHSIVTDNGSNFTSKEFKAYCAEVGIKLSFASVAHPQTNGQVEKANGIICNGIKKRLLGPLEKARHTWPEELPNVLWSIRTTPNTATQETPFFLVHGAEAVLPIEIEHDSPRVTEYDEETSREALDGASAIKFIKSIVFRFGVPHSIVTDNGSNFTSKEFKAYCAEVGIKLSFASVAHPQTNGQVEKANGIICNGIKKRLLGPLEKARHTWPEELPSVLWSIRTTPNTATQETPFFLVHGAAQPCR
ncbi:hypothetical protein QYE76_022866 [Lolium multiflorum]|uniref:Integrase catalytic domain-containing protein n=1 Tax=Lolium multiflorum TaxID=4521 RepID=A0AAD8RC91_LOLMU|nr:hypothetical protein QYE76_022866 [Lolium multiflorum]